MRSRAISFALGLTIAAVTSGCTVKTIDAPVTVSTKLLPELSRPEVQQAAKEVTGTSCDRVVLFFIPIGVATAESAYADALAQAPGADTLIRYESRMTSLFLWPFYFETCAIVHGYAVSSKSLE